MVIVAGVCGTGKTAVSQRLGARLLANRAATAPAVAVVEGDDWHPAENKQKMATRSPLQDRDRWPWLHSLRAHIAELAGSHAVVIVACSALKLVYRDVFRTLVPEASGVRQVQFVWLACEPRVLRERLETRKGHFMAATMLDSQLRDADGGPSAAESDVVVVDVTNVSADAAAQAIAAEHLRGFIDVDHTCPDA